MKKALLSAIGFLSFLTIEAQEQTPIQQDLRRHNLEITYGGPALCYFGEGESYNKKYSLSGLYEDQEYATGTIVIGVQYNYLLKKWLSVGVDVSWGLVQAEISPGYAFRQSAWDEGTTLYQNIISVMPSVRARWLHTRITPSWGFFSMYSKASAGAYLSVGNYKSTQVKPAWETVFLGWTLGSETIYAFEEVGYGTCYLVRLGLGFNF